MPRRFSNADLEDMHAQNELLRYQINLSQSNYQVEQAAAALAMRPAQPTEVDYVVLPHSDHAVVMAELDPAAARRRSPRGAAELCRRNGAALTHRARRSQPQPPLLSGGFFCFPRPHAGGRATAARVGERVTN